MRKLLRANLNRLKKSKVFWFGNLVMLALCALICIEKYKEQIEYDIAYKADYFIFGSFMMIGIVLSVFISLYVGTEYSDGTIRNKIVAGHKRRHIYLANFILCALAAAAGVLSSVMLLSVLGIPMFGFFQTEIPYLLLLIADYLLAAVAYTAIFQLVSMICQNKVYAAVINILLAFVFLIVGIYLYQRITAPEMSTVAELVNGPVTEGADLTDMEITYVQEPNPYYLTGIKREVYQFFLDFLPCGQAMQIAQWDVLHPYRLPVFSIIIVIISNAAGILILQKKDIK